MSSVPNTAVRRWGQSWSAAILVLVVVFCCALSVAGQAERPAANAKSVGEEFFIISSVDTGKKQLLLKEPTEITEVLQVNDKTRYTDKNAKAIQFADLRAGDTIYVRTAMTAAGKVAVSIRKGPMTVGELRRRYLK
jgi:hypothetical protein